MFVNNNTKLVSKYKESWNFTVVNYDTNHFAILRFFPKRMLNAGLAQDYYRRTFKVNLGENIVVLVKCLNLSQ